MAQVAPASAAAMRPSANGKNASLAIALPLRERPASCAFQIAIRDESTRDIWPAPIARVRSGAAYTMAFDFTCLTTRQPNRIASSSLCVGWRFETTRSLSSAPVSESCTSKPPQTDRTSFFGKNSGQGASNRMRRRFFFFCKIVRASPENSGAIITSLKISLITLASDSSISRLQIMMPPKGACLSVANALSQAWRRSESLPTPHGLVCFNSEALTQLQRRLPIVITHGFEHEIVICRIDHDRDALIFFGGTSNH